MNSFLRDRVYFCFADTVASETCVSVDTMYAAMLAGTEAISALLLFPFFIHKSIAICILEWIYTRKEPELDTADNHIDSS